MTVRKSRDRGWMIDVVFLHVDGHKVRVRRTSPVQTKRGAEQYEREVRERMLRGAPDDEGEKKEVPTLQAFSKEFLETYCAVNNKPSSLRNKRTTFRKHLVPAFGRKRLDEINGRDIERFKANKLQSGLSPKTINNHLTTLRKMLDIACEWGLIEHLPRVKWLRVPPPEFDFLDFDEAERLLETAREHEAEFYVMILVALRTGMRQGELLALQWAILILSRVG